MYFYNDFSINIKTKKKAQIIIFNNYLASKLCQFIYCFIADNTAIKTLSGKPCQFPFKSGGITYKRSCVKISDHDPGWCFVQGDGKLIKDKCIPSGG